MTMFPSLPIACHLHSIVTVQSFTQDQERLLRKEGSQGKGVPAIPGLNQPGFDGEIDQEQNQEPCPKRLALTEEWACDVLQSTFTPLKESENKRCLRVRHLLTKHAREEQRQRPFYNTGSFDAYAIEEDSTALIRLECHRPIAPIFNQFISF